MRPTGQSDERLQRIVRTLGVGEPAALIDRMCGVCVDVLGITGAGVTVRGPQLASSLCASGPQAAALEDLSLSLGEGPAVDAYIGGVPIGEPDLVGTRRTRWPVFRPHAISAGAAAIFAFPLRVGAVRLGSLMLYRDGPGKLSDEQHRDALAMSGVVMDVVLTNQAQARPGLVPLGVEAMSVSRAEVHQAAGTVSVQAGVSVAEGLLLLRARAHSDGRPLIDVARDVVARRIRLSA